VFARTLRLAALVLLASACTGNAPNEARASLKADALSPKYHSGFWAEEAGKLTTLWKEAQQLCRAQQAGLTPNCRVFLAVDVTVRIIAVHQDEDLGERLKAWIRGGTRELGLPTSGSTPRPAKGFGPEPPKMPVSVGK
jgi:hypothetical protein